MAFDEVHGVFDPLPPVVEQAIKVYLERIQYCVRISTEFTYYPIAPLICSITNPPLLLLYWELSSRALPNNVIIVRADMQASVQNYPTQKVDTNLNLEAWSVVFTLKQLVSPERSYTVLHHHRGAIHDHREIAAKKNSSV